MADVWEVAEDLEIVATGERGRTEEKEPKTRRRSYWEGGRGLRSGRIDGADLHSSLLAGLWGWVEAEVLRIGTSRNCRV